METPDYMMERKDLLLQDEKSRGHIEEYCTAHGTRKPRQSKASSMLWLVGILLMLVTTSFTTYWIIDKRAGRCHPLGSFDRGYTTEFTSMFPLIHLETRRLWGTLKFNHTLAGHAYMDADSPAQRYSGLSSESEQHWQDLLKDHWFLITEEEAKEALGPQYVDFWSTEMGGYAATLDVFHSLHCLHQLRMAPHLDRYKGEAGIRNQVHMDHCITYLLQQLMCQADATLVPTQYEPELGRNYLFSERPHTCRDFAPIRDWVTRRSVGDLMVLPRDPCGPVASAATPTHS